MDYYKKAKIKDFLQKHKKAIIGTSIFIGVAIVALLVGFGLSGWSIIKWFEKGYGATFFIMLVLGGFALFLILYIFKAIKDRK